MLSVVSVLGGTSVNIQEFYLASSPPGESFLLVSTNFINSKNWAFMWKVTKAHTIKPVYIKYLARFYLTYHMCVKSLFKYAQLLIGARGLNCSQHSR